MAVSELPGNPNAVWTVKTHSQGEVSSKTNIQNTLIVKEVHSFQASFLSHFYSNIKLWFFNTYCVLSLQMSLILILWCPS